MPSDTIDMAVEGSQLHVLEQDEKRREQQQEDSLSSSPSHPRVGSIVKHDLGDLPEDFPSEHDLLTLRRVADHIPIKLFTIAFLELCERFSYYGTIIVVCRLSGIRPLMFFVHD